MSGSSYGCFVTFTSAYYNLYNVPSFISPKPAIAPNRKLPIREKIYPSESRRNFSSTACAWSNVAFAFWMSESRGSLPNKTAVASSTTFSCFPPATENDRKNRSTSGGRGFLAVAMSVRLRVLQRPFGGACLVAFRIPAPPHRGLPPMGHRSPKSYVAWERPPPDRPVRVCWFSGPDRGQPAPGSRKIHLFIDNLRLIKPSEIRVPAGQSRASTSTTLRPIRRASIKWRSDYAKSNKRSSCAEFSLPSATFHNKPQCPSAGNSRS